MSIKYVTLSTSIGKNMKFEISGEQKKALSKNKLFHHFQGAFIFEKAKD